MVEINGSNHVRFRANRGNYRTMRNTPPKEIPLTQPLDHSQACEGSGHFLQVSGTGCRVPLQHTGPCPLSALTWTLKPSFSASENPVASLPALSTAPCNSSQRGTGAEGPLSVPSSLQMTRCPPVVSFWFTCDTEGPACPGEASDADSAESVSTPQSATSEYSSGL